MVKMPLAMGQAVSQHSNVIRRAAWTHYGFVVGQEGDSFILAFRDACDAVAFCLQVGGRHRSYVSCARWCTCCCSCMDIGGHANRVYHVHVLTYYLSRSLQEEEEGVTGQTGSYAATHPRIVAVCNKSALPHFMARARVLCYEAHAWCLAAQATQYHHKLCCHCSCRSSRGLSKYTGRLNSCSISSSRT